MRDRSSGTAAAAEIMRVMDAADQVDTCMEWVRFRFRSLLFCLALAGFGQARVIEGRRTFDRQCELYGRGRSKDEMAVIGLSGEYARPDDRRVTWLDPRYSRHVKGMAIDVDFSEYCEGSMEVVGSVARELGITWGGVWSVRDYAHFEL